MSIRKPLDMNTENKTYEKVLVRTGIYSLKFLKFLNKFVVHTVKHNPSAFGNTTNASINHTFPFIQDYNGEVLIVTKSSCVSRNTIFVMRKFDTAEILNWYAYLIKSVIMRMCEQQGYDFNKHWTRTDDTYITSNGDTDMSLTFSDIHLIYDILRGRKNLEQYYSKESIEAWHGKQRDPLTAEMIKTQETALTELESDYQAKIRDCSLNGYQYNTDTAAQKEINMAFKNLEKEYKQKVKDLEHQYYAKYEKQKQLISKEYDEKVRKIRSELKELIELCG